MDDWGMRDVCIVADSAEYAGRALALSTRLDVPLGDGRAFVLRVGADGLRLSQCEPVQLEDVRVDFVAGAVAYRHQFGGGRGQLIAKAVGLGVGTIPTVLDATAGLGRDAFVLASLGCRVTLIERHPLVAALLEDGLARALGDAVAGPVAKRMHLRTGDAIALMRAWDAEVPQVIYLDPMFPHRDKSALVKKEMRVFRPLVGDDPDAPTLLDAALALASHRVVVKRARKAPAIKGGAPSHVLEGNSSRFDVYAKKTLRTRPQP